MCESEGPLRKNHRTRWALLAVQAPRSSHGSLGLSPLSKRRRSSSRLAKLQAGRVSPRRLQSPPPQSSPPTSRLPSRRSPAPPASSPAHRSRQPHLPSSFASRSPPPDPSTPSRRRRIRPPWSPVSPPFRSPSASRSPPLSLAGLTSSEKGCLRIHSSLGFYRFSTALGPSRCRYGTRKLLMGILKDLRMKILSLTYLKLLEQMCNRPTSPAQLTLLPLLELSFRFLPSS